MADSLRADHLGCYGSREVNTPNIDKLAEEGILFFQCVCMRTKHDNLGSIFAYINLTIYA